MALPVFIWICALFMIGRNIPSLFLKIRDLVSLERRKQWVENSSKLFTVIILIVTAVAGLVSGIALFFQNVIFGYYLFIIVSGMMIYSYFIYAGNCLEEKKRFMFGLCLCVIIFTSILAGLMSFYLATGVID